MMRDIPIEAMQLFANEGRVYRAFDHLIAARPGALMIVPIRLVTGSVQDVIDGCPVPHEEVYAVLEYQSADPVHCLRSTMPELTQINRLGYLGFDLYEFTVDRISPMVNGHADNVLRLSHPSGVRYAVVMP